MLRSYFLLCFRSILKYKISSIISISGLSISIACVLLISLYIRNELIIDADKALNPDTYFVSITQSSNSTSREVGMLSSPFMEWLNEQPSVTSTLGYRELGTFYFAYGENKIEEKISLTQQEIFNYFDYKLLKGIRENALTEPNSIVISKKMADKLFPNENPMGKVIKMLGDEKFNFKITGVIEDSENTSISYQSLISWDSKSENGGLYKDWYQYSVFIFIQANQSDAEKLTTSLNQSYQKENPENSYYLNFYRFEDFYFNNGRIEFMTGFRSGNYQNIYVLIVMGFLLIVIGSMNYVNINISIILKRIREIGVRQSLGATKSDIIKQFSLDTFILVTISSVIALTIADLFAQLNPGILNSNVGDFIFLNPYILTVLFTVILLITLFSSIYPAILSRRISTSNALKNKIDNRNSSNSISNVLLGIQFFIAFGLLISAFTVYMQYDFIKDKELGHDKENIMILTLMDSKNLLDNINLVTDNIRNFPEVISASYSTDVLGDGYTNNSFYASTPEMMDVEKEGVMSYYFGIDSSFITTYGLNLKMGRNFNSLLASDSNAVIINEALNKQLNLKDPINSKIKMYGEESSPKTIIGVVQDFNFQSLHKKIEPAVFYLTPRNLWNISIKYRTTDFESFQKKLVDLWNKYEKEVPIEYSFLDTKLERFYEKEKGFNNLLTGFTFVSILLSLVGLFGVTLYTIEQHQKEISIRKVLGASSVELLMMFNKKFVITLLVAILFSAPIAIYFMNKWLENFAFRIGLRWDLYFLTFISIILLVMTTVSMTSFRTTRSNPTRYLRND